jgi:hypothetical protein
MQVWSSLTDLFLLILPSLRVPHPTPKRTWSQYRRGRMRRPKDARKQRWRLLNNPLRTLGNTLATSLAQRQSGYRFRRRLADYGPKAKCKWPPPRRRPRTMGLRFPVAICRLRVNAESGSLIARRGISLHPANARSCDIGFRQGPIWCTVESPSVHFWWIFTDHNGLLSTQSRL